jgi:hypothetical protein
MKIAYNFNNRLIVQEVSELPTFEHVIIDNVDLFKFMRLINYGTIKLPYILCGLRFIATIFF